MAGIGRFTGCALGNVTSLCLPWTDRNGRTQPAFSHEAALLSLELSSTAYDLDLDAWREAGWRDISYMVDNTLLTGTAVNRPSGGIAGAISDYFQHLAQSRLNRLNPISQLRGALRQREKVDTCKAVVMLRPVSDGQYLVAIGFMGTGKRIYDWFSNFHLKDEEGVHSGFLQLTKEFEKNCGEICFPETARELGLSQLTLTDILKECRFLGSRFRLWMAGHSQGGAIMQLFALRAEKFGVLRQHMIGYSFASPSTVYVAPPCDLASFPLFHIINACDVFPRVGARLHIGQCRIMYPDEAMRSSCYQSAWREPLYREAAWLLGGVGDGGDGFLRILALLNALETLPPDDVWAVISAFVGSLIPEKLLSALGSRRESLLRALIRRAARGYELSTCGKELPKEQLALLTRRVQRLIARYGALPFIQAVLKYITLSHRLRGENSATGTASYQYIVTQRFDSLRRKVWCAPADQMAAPVRSGRRRLPGGRFAAYSAARNCVSARRRNR